MCSFYPLYPAHPSTPLDTTSDHALRLSSLPDLMLLPSDLAPFAKVVSPEAPGGPEATAGTEGGKQTHNGCAGCVDNMKWFTCAA